MRKNLESKLLIERNIDVEGSNAAIFKTYVDKATLGQWILDSYLEKRVRVDANFKRREDGKYLAFINSARENDVGYLSDIYGYVGILSLAMRMGVKLTDEQAKDVADNVCIILDYIDKNGYTLNPYLSDEENYVEPNGKLFSRRSPYTGSMTWALSFYTSVRAAVKNGIITLDKSRQDEIVNNIRKIIEYFNSAFIRKDGVPMGWGYTEGTVNSSLFFTYSVLEAYSDFEDSVFDITYVGDEEFRTMKDEELLNAINKGKQEGDTRIEIEWKENCYAVADQVWDKYRDVLKENFVDDTFLRNYQVVTRDDILKSERSNALFNNIYLVCILLYGYVNRRSADKDDVILTMEAALQNVQRVYHQVNRLGISYLVETYIIPFKSPHKDRGYEYLRLNYKNLVDASLMPLLVKANNIMAYYISQYPVKQMSVFFEDLFDHMSEIVVDGQPEWVWENKGYDVKINERYIEAIADFYAYYEQYESDYADKKNAKDRATKELIRSEREKERNKVYAEAEASAEEKFRTREKEIRAEYTIENEIRAAIQNGVSGTITEMLDSISSKLGRREPLTEAETRLYNSLTGFIGACFVKMLDGVVADKASLPTIVENSKTDVNMFLAEWAERLVGSKDALTKIMKGD